MKAGRKRRDSRTKARGKTLGERIVEAREKKNLTREGLAIKAKVGIETLRKIEAGKVASPSLFTIADLAKVLGKKVDEWVK